MRTVVDEALGCWAREWSASHDIDVVTVRILDAVM